jgi:hypothetical protein
MQETQRPIGYWVKHVDGLIEATFDRTLADLGLGRCHWQMLHLLALGPRPEAALDEALAPFWAAGGVPTRAAVLQDLLQRGWVVSDDGRCALTPSGESAQHAIAERVQLTRQRTTQGLSAADYANTLRTLERMAANLEASLPAHTPGATPSHV